MKPGVLTLITGIVCFAVGAIAIPLIIILPLVFENSNDLQFKVPGTIEVPVGKPGRYYLWNNYQTIYKGTSYNRPQGIPDGMEIRIRNENGKLLEFVSDTSMSSTCGASASNSVGYVKVDGPGKLKIEITGGNEDRIFSFARSRLLTMIVRIAGGLLLSMVIGFGGLGMIIWGIVKLVRANKKSEGLAAPNCGT